MWYNWLLILFGSALGMLLTIVVQSEIINRSQKFEEGFKDAFKFYTRKERGGIYVGAIVIFIFMFILPNLVATSMKGLEHFLERIRIYSVLVGVLAQAGGFAVVKKSHEKLKKVEDQN